MYQSIEVCQNNQNLSLTADSIKPYCVLKNAVKVIDMHSFVLLT